MKFDRLYTKTDELLPKVLDGDEVAIAAALQSAGRTGEE